MGWVEFIIYMVVMIVLAVAAYMMAPKPKTPKPSFQTDPEVPGADAGRPVNVVFGDLKVKSPNCLGSWDFETKVVKVKV